MKECDVFRGPTHSLTPPTYFPRVKTHTPRICDLYHSYRIVSVNQGANVRKKISYRELRERCVPTSPVDALNQRGGFNPIQFSSDQHAKIDVMLVLDASRPRNKIRSLRTLPAKKMRLQ